jgi:hypothetical protein
VAALVTVNDTNVDVVEDLMKHPQDGLGTQNVLSYQRCPCLARVEGPRCSHGSTGGTLTRKDIDYSSNRRQPPI